jgi:putative ABC transport system permease protein
MKPTLPPDAQESSHWKTAASSQTDTINHGSLRLKSLMLYSFCEALRSAVLAIRTHGLRSSLTILGIVIGVASVIAMVSIVQGFGQSIHEVFRGLGGNGLTIAPYTPRNDELQGKVAKLTYGDMLEIDHQIDSISHITPIVKINAHISGRITYYSKSHYAEVWGTSSSYQALSDNYPVLGRFLNRTDDANRRRVCVVGWKVFKELGLPDNPVGDFLRIGGEWFRIIGVMEEQGELLGISRDDYVLIPFSTARSIIGAAHEPSIIVQLKVDDHDLISVTKNQIKRVLRREHKLDLQDEDDFKIQTAAQLMETIDKVAGTLTVVLGGVVGISLLVGGIGIMNIMLVSVTERTREIGICKALGAKRSDILMQFLMEGVILALFGGLIGVAQGYGLGVLIASLVPQIPQTITPWWIIAIAVGFSGAVGVVFGIIPAAKAANLEPIEALRYE